MTELETQKQALSCLQAMANGGRLFVWKYGKYQEFRTLDDMLWPPPGAEIPAGELE